MKNQNLFKALQNVCGFTALESDMFEIINAYEKDKAEADVMPSLPSKDKAVDVGFTKAKNADYNYRKVLRNLDHDIYYSGWMDCFEWIVGNEA